MGVALPLLAFPILLRLGRLERADAARMAAHYGSVSVGTFAVGFIARYSAVPVFPNWRP
jgi:hypothetical protein